MADRASAFGRGLAQGASLGWSDEAFAKLLKAIPVDDGTGIPREYAGGQENQYLAHARGEDAEAARKYPLNFGAGNVLGAAPAVIATGGAGGLGTVAGGAALGAVQGAGLSSSKGQELLKDAIRGGALGGAIAAGGNALATTARAATPAIQRMFQAGPPQGPAPAMATVGAVQNVGRSTGSVDDLSQVNRATSVSDIPMPAPQRVSGKPPPRRDSLPAMEIPQFPKPAKVPKISEADLDMVDEQVRRANNKVSDDLIKKHGKGILGDKGTKTARPPRKKVEAPEQPAQTPEVTPEMQAALARLARASTESEKIGQGHARAVFDDQGQALKIARKPAGLAQNKAEAELSGRSEVLNPVQEAAPDFSWVKQRMAQPFDEENLVKHAGLEPEQLKDISAGHIGPQRTPEAQELYERLNQVMREVPELDPRDLGKAGQWGLDSKGRPVLIDYGFLKAMPLGIAGIAGSRDDK